VPAIVISSWVKEGTVFRSNTSVPLDHTSVLATLRDWRGLSSGYDSMLPSPRIAAAPNLGFVLTEAEPRSWPIISTESLAELSIPEPDDDEPLNDVQRWIVIGAAGRVAGRPYTREESQLAYARLRTHGDARTWLMALEPHLPLK
jgi:phospholipase C